MKQERTALQEAIYFVLTDLNRKGTIKDLLKSRLLDEYMNKMVLTKTLNLNLTLDNLSVSELYHITRLINENKQRINVNNYFTDDEMTIAIENKNNEKLNVSDIIEFKNVLYSKSNNEESWMCIVTYKQIYEWMKTGKLVYNMETQRQGVMRKIGKEMIVVPYINEKSIKEIKQDMLNSEFSSNMICINITQDYNNKLEYNQTDRILTIDTNIFEVAVTDGWHRCSAAMGAIEKNKNLYGELYLKITNTSIEKAQKFIRQQSKTNTMDEEYFEKFNPNNKITMVINNINSMGSINTNVLYNKIDTGVNSPDTWILFENFKEGLYLSGFIDEINKTTTNKQVMDIENFIVKFFDTFYKIAEDNNIKVVEDETLTDPTFIMGLLITCYKYFAIKEINIETMDIFLKKFKKSTTKYIYDYPFKFKDKSNMISKFSRLLEVE